MRASVTAARLKYRMRAICYFGPAPLEDRMSALRRVNRWRRRASRRPKKIGASLLGVSWARIWKRELIAYPSVIGWRLSAGTHMRRRLIAQTAPSSVRSYGHTAVYLPLALSTSTWHLLESVGATKPVSGASAVAPGGMPISSSGPITGTRPVGAVIATGATLRTPRRVPKLGVGGRRERQQVDRCRRQKRYAYVFHVLNLLYCCSCEARRATACISAARSRCRAFGSGCVESSSRRQ